MNNTNMINFSNDEVVFISDTHFGHLNIIKYCDRPFKNVQEMDRLMWDNLLKADAQGKTIVHLGDVLFHQSGMKIPYFRNSVNHILIVGNHDKLHPIQELYPKIFGTIIGTRGTWKEHYHTISIDSIPLILSHEPQQKLHNCQFNLYGHHHNNMTRDPVRFLPEYDW